jgi:phospholipid transport system substrate-binding protein
VEEIMSRILTLAVALLIFTVVAETAPALALGPMEGVKGNVDSIFGILRDPNSNPDEMREEVYKTVRAWFDFKIMSQGVLAKAWKTTDVERRDEFTKLFTELLETTYCDRINNFSDERVEYLAERIKGKRGEVDIIIYSGNQEIPITYKLVRRNDRWPVYDVVIEGVSLIKNYRDSYREIIAKEGLDFLLARMAEKIKTCRITIRQGDVDRSLVP